LAFPKETGPLDLEETGNYHYHKPKEIVMKKSKFNQPRTSFATSKPRRALRSKKFAGRWAYLMPPFTTEKRRALGK
jgi:hypothetical protein